MKPSFDVYPQDDDILLKCPLCDSTYLHHERVEVFNREEDDVTGLHTNILLDNVSVDNNLDGNPSKRRNGLKIYFWCEGCSENSAMSIVQHKGSTYFSIE